MGIPKISKHTSATCKNKIEGHKDEATSDNKMGGSTKVWTRREKAGQGGTAKLTSDKNNNSCSETHIT